jgi:MFS family permease
MKEIQTTEVPARPAPKNAIVLSIAQGLFTAAISVDLTLTGLTGYQLAPNKSFATLPFALITVAGAIATLFASLLMQRIGRRKGFIIGALTCAVGGAVSVQAVLHQNFWMFCFGTSAVGVFQAFAQYYRLAAADGVSNENKAQAISMVLVGGVIAAVLGPVLAMWSQNWLDAQFAGSYMLVAFLGSASVLLISGCYRDLEGPAAVTSLQEDTPRPLSEIFRQPISLAAFANNAIGNAIMMLAMTAAPIAAVANHHGIDDGAKIIQWHLVGMYAPSLFAGRLISRFGIPTILFSGMALTLTCAVVAIASSSLFAFYVALLCLGVGWNFMFVGGTTLLAESHKPHERARVQGAAELIRYALTTLATLGAGPLLEHYGWRSLNLAILPMLAVSAYMTLVWVKADRRPVDHS